MTEKDYKLIASVIAKHHKKLGLSFVTDMAEALQSDNPRFNDETFLRACYPKAETEPE